MKQKTVGSGNFAGIVVMPLVLVLSGERAALAYPVLGSGALAPAVFPAYFPPLRHPQVFSCARRRIGSIALAEVTQFNPAIVPSGNCEQPGSRDAISARHTLASHLTPPLRRSVISFSVESGPRCCIPSWKSHEVFGSPATL